MEDIDKLIREELVPKLFPSVVFKKQPSFKTSEEAWVNSDTPISIKDIEGKEGK